MTKEEEEFRNGVIQEFLGERKEDWQKETLKENPRYLDDNGIYMRTLKELLKEEKDEDGSLYEKYGKRELTESNPPHICAAYSSSRIGLYYFLGEREKAEKKGKNIHLRTELDLPIKTKEEGTIATSHPDFSYVLGKGEKEKEEIHYVESKTTEILERKSCQLKEAYLPLLKEYCGLEPEPGKEDAFLKNLNDQFLRYEGAKFIEKSRVEFKQVLTHLFGIMTEINDKDDGHKKYLDYHFFYPSDSHPFKEEIEKEFELFKSSTCYKKLEEYAKGKIYLSDPQFHSMKEIKDPVLERLKKEE